MMSSCDYFMSCFRSLKPQDKPDWSQDPLYKTALCNKWEEAEGSCEYGDSCRFAHGSIIIVIFYIFLNVFIFRSVRVASDKIY